MRTAGPDPLSGSEAVARVTVQPGDILAVAGSGWLSRAIMFLTRAPVSHVGLIIGSNPPIVIEALTRVRTRPLWVSIADDTHAWILQPKRLHREYRWRIVARACQYSADSYDYLKILLQLADALAGWLVGHRVAWFTATIGALSNRPICSYEVGEAFAADGLNFGVPDRAATPGDIFEFAQGHSEWYEVVQLK